MARTLAWVWVALLAHTVLSFTVPPGRRHIGTLFSGAPQTARFRAPGVFMRVDKGSRAPPEPRGPTAVMNEFIKVPEIRVVLASKNPAESGDEMLGIMNTAEALAKARDLNLDLVMISDKSDPPVCKIVDYGKLRYQQERKKKENLKKTKNNELKEVKMSYKIDKHDYQVRQRAALKFLSSGSRVKVVIQFRGREQQHIDLGTELLKKISEDCGELSSSDKPKREGNRLIMFMNPKENVKKQ